LQQQQPPPGDEDELISNMMDRLEVMEHAITECEQIIGHERINRKNISQDIKAKNIELKGIIAGEKETLNNKVVAHMEENLETAVRDRMKLKAVYDKTNIQLPQTTEQLDDVEFELNSLRQKQSDQN